MFIPSGVSAVWIWKISVLLSASECVCLVQIISIGLTHFFFLNAYVCSRACAYVTCPSVYDGRLCPQSQIAIKRRGNDCVKMALKEPGAQLARPISVRVAADDSQFSQPIIWALIYAQRGHSPPLTNQRPECLRLVTMANQSSVSIQSQRQSSKVAELLQSIVLAKTRTRNTIYWLQDTGKFTSISYLTDGWWSLR